MRRTPIPPPGQKVRHNLRRLKRVHPRRQQLTTQRYEILHAELLNAVRDVLPVVHSFVVFHGCGPLRRRQHHARLQLDANATAELSHKRHTFPHLPKHPTKRVACFSFTHPNSVISTGAQRSGETPVLAVAVVVESAVALAPTARPIPAKGEAPRTDATNAEGRRSDPSASLDSRRSHPHSRLR